MHVNGRQQQLSDDSDRTNRFLSNNGVEHGLGLQRERAASQPPRSHGSQGFLSSPGQQYQGIGNFSGNGGLPWSNQRANSSLHPRSGSSSGLPMSVPTRSSSFSVSPQTQFSSAIRESRAFGSTLEDDESEALSDTYDDRYLPPSLQRGRSYAVDLTRSRSQSLAASRPGAIGSQIQGQPMLGGWEEEALSSSALNIPGSRYNDIKLSGGNRQSIDVSNMSPFVRDVGQILLDDGSAFRELWAGNPPRDENGIPGSGTTSRRHSVSVVQPRRPTIVGFNAPGTDTSAAEESSRPFQQGFGRSGLMLSDDDLAGDLNMLSLNVNDGSTPMARNPQSQPSSLPIYTPLSRSPPTTDRLSPYQSMNLSIPGGSFSRQPIGTPSESGLSAGGSPSRTGFDHHHQQQQQHQPSGQFFNAGPQQQLARFVPGHGIQGGDMNGSVFPRTSAYNTAMPSPVSPTGVRSPQAFYAQQQRPRLSSDASATGNFLTDLGKGLPLHSVPPSWPLYIVEFKAGRTDLFYLQDLSLDIRVGDLVIVEADRGKDLGKVVNDTITLAEVEAFQKQQQAKAGMSDGQPLSPGGTPSSSSKKEINPKMIYGKAQAQDTQLLMTKIQDEVKALQLCQSKVRQKKLPMEVVDAEYQWDRRKLTFYFVAEKRIDFRELVRELFRLYKTRIWMASLQGPGGYEQ